ncbi:hypothetical protein [Tellurirhabdus rosea]|uniref:hypothetical protein n=1 Tax=Tellurirhabdus rosea TaxID=2674997 RepID=UPI002251E501|nr:hypothetical protein [Tellurirhabdus rosea]
MSLYSTFAFSQEVAVRNSSAEAASVKRDTTVVVDRENAAPVVRKTDYAVEYYRGTRDADQYYTGYKGAGTGTLIASLISPLAGLIPAIACSTTPPREMSLGYPNSTTYEHADYRMGYNRQAKKIKSRKVWTNWGIGLGTNLILALILASK